MSDYTQKIVPKLCQPQTDEDGYVTEAAYTGHVVMKCLSFEERMALHDEFERDEEAYAGPDTGKKRDRNVHWWRFLARKVPSYVEGVHIDRVEDGHEFRSWEELTYESALDRLVVEIAVSLIGRSRVGNG